MTDLYQPEGWPSSSERVLEIMVIADAYAGPAGFAGRDKRDLGR